MRDEQDAFAEHQLEHRAAAAPSAMRSPNSRVRWLTEVPMTPAMPARVISSAMAAKIAEQRRGQPRRRQPAVAQLVERLQLLDRALRVDAVHGGLDRRREVARIARRRAP